MYRISRPNMTLRRWEKTGKFPPRQQRAEGERWSEQRVLAWLQQQAGAVATPQG
jgi:DNA-binding transcriptional MerR regulator